MERKKTIAIIPARGGSKRLINKNLISLNGKPLIEWTIDEALKSKYIDELIVSTDSEKIKEFCERKGVNVPFLRPEELSNDTARTIDVIIHTLDFYKSRDNNFDYCILLQPTSPLRLKNDIESAFDSIESDSNIKAVVSVCETEHSPIWCNTLPEDLSMSNFIPEQYKNIRSQDLPNYYRLNGAIYIAEINYLYENKGFINDKTKAYVMPKERSIDIDEEADLVYADFMLKKRSNED